MKKEWRKKWAQKIGSMLLCAVLLCGNIQTDVYAVMSEEVQSVEKNEESITTSENDLANEEDITVSEDNPTEKQYHLIEEEPDSVEKWLSLYCPNGFKDLLAQDKTWWDALYDYERAYAEFLVGMIIDLSEDVYDEQELSECIRILESGIDPDEFFKGTIFEGVMLEELQALYDAGGTMEDLAEEMPIQGSRMMLLAAEEEEIPEERIAKVSVVATGYSGTEHGLIYKITLGGVPALCISFGKNCRSSFLYRAGIGEYQKKTGALGYFARNANNSGAEYVACQIAAWLFLKDTNLSEVAVKSRAQAMVNITSRISLNKMTAYVWDFYSGAKTYNGTYYEYNSANENAQLLITDREVNTELRTPPVKPTTPGESQGTLGDGKVSQNIEITYAMDINKKDWQTGIGLPGCAVQLFENGAYLTTVETDESGHAEYEVKKTASFSIPYDGVEITEEKAWKMLEQKIAEFTATRYTYSVREMTAPTGYTWAANEQSESIPGGETAEFHLTNERTLGAVELIKYDTESESEKAQGDASLDGAVYGIYAAEDIVHQDRMTGIIIDKDELVQTAVIGKTPKRNSSGYILNEDETRHIAQKQKTIAYVDTPGRTLFGDLELGSYYIKEITPAKGYMLDEAVYPVSFTYKDQMVKIESRNEMAGQAENELTADNGSTAEAVYSGDYVNKQGIQFIKTSDNAWQTEITPIEGAGFSAYLISDLSGVKDGHVSPLGETWTADDIMTFYDYDFTKEKTATVYKRTDHETWTTGDKLWLQAAAGQNEYYVKEMFTDENGRIETPELPYGLYVVVETTTPEYHTAAKPFIVCITEDGGALYTDITKTKIEKAYTKEEGIRYGDHRDTKTREGRVLQKQRFVNNMVTMTYLRVLKADKEFREMPGTYIKAEEFVRGTVLKEGAAYLLKCITMPLSKNSLLALNWKFDEDGYLSYYDQNTRKMFGTEDNPFGTKLLKKNGEVRDCYILLPGKLPVGTYELEEKTAPAGYVLNGWEQSVSDKSTNGINRYEIVDSPSSKVVFTINNGAVYPDGQMGTNKYALTDEYGNLTVTILQENQEQKGIIEITKHGKQLSAVKKDSVTLLDKLAEEPFRPIKKAEESTAKDIIFSYEDAPVEGAVFEIVAAEDIYTQEIDKTMPDNAPIRKAEYLLYQEGDVAATVTTDHNGWGYAANLYIGKYKIRETIAGNGFVLNKKETAFEITKKEQHVNFDIHTADYENERQKLEITVKKQDDETGTSLAGAVYGLYARENIVTNIEKQEDTGKWTLRDMPETLCTAGTLIATCITDRNGIGIFDEDLPLGEYDVRELEAPAGYLTALKDIRVDGSYDSIKGGQQTKKQEHRVTFKDKKTKAVITKRAVADGEKVEGAVLEVKEIEQDLDGNPKKDAAGNNIVKTVASWESKADENGHLINGLCLEKMYILSEKSAPEHYLIAEDILFKIVQEKEEGKLTDITGLYVLKNGIWERAVEDLLVMYDERETIKVEKSTIAMTQYGDSYQYRVDALRNEAPHSVEQFTVTDHLPKGIYLTKLWTGTYNENLCYDAEYRTNQSEGWILWEEDLSTEKNNCLEIPETLQTPEEYITEFRLRFGTVGGSFGETEAPVYMTHVSSEAEAVIYSDITLTAEHNGNMLEDGAETKTLLYLRSIAGYHAGGGGEPIYEIVGEKEEKPEETTETPITRRIVIPVAEQAARGRNRLEIIEDEEVPIATMYRSGNVKTGDDVANAMAAQTAFTAIAGAGILCLFARRRKNKK